MTDHTISEGMKATRSGTITFSREAADSEARTIPASLSSDAPIAMPWGPEVLVHTKDAIDLSRAAENGLIMLFNHDRNMPIGRIRDIRIEGGKLRGNMYFSNNEKAREVYQDVIDGFLGETSISYNINEYEERDDQFIVTRWTITEGSIVTIPADPSVGANRSKREGDNMATKDQDNNGGGEVVDFTAARQLALIEGREEGRRLERERIDGIRSLFSLPKFKAAPVYQQLEAEALRQGWSVDETRGKLIELIGDGTAPIVAPSQTDDSARSAYIQAGAQQSDKLAGIIEKTLNVRGGLETEQKVIDEVRASGFRNYSLMEISREYLRAHNVNTHSMTKRELAGAVFSRALISHNTDDFTGILANTAGKAALMGWTEAPETWQMWTRKGNLSDFKSTDRAGLGEFPDLDLIYENGEYKFATMNDRKESLQLATYGKMISISREAIINDDLSQFTTVPRKMGRAAKRKIGDIVYTILTSNPTLAQDSTSLFHADHNNLVANGSGAAPSVATLNAAFAAMKKQTDNDGNATALGIIPEYLIVPVALEATALEIASNTYDPAATAGTMKINPYNGRLTVIGDARLDANDVAAWFLAANPNIHDTVEVAFLDGNEEPYIERVEAVTQDGVSFKVRIDAVAGALGYQGLYMNDGN